MGLTESSWRERERERAAQDVRLDLLLEAVSASEGLDASDAEVATEVAALASRHGLETPELMAAIDREAVRASLSRDKARRLIIDSAISASEAKRP
jgi:trigger factor